MPRQITLLNVFVSCPQELAAERSIVESVVAELNPKLRDSFGLELRVITWANFVVPGVGPDPQTVINSQIGENYDIYIGMLGARFGTRTPRAGSGTEEEFTRAFDRFRGKEESVRIFFYFKNSSDVPLQNLDLEQLAKVQAFRKRIGSEGALYADFKTTDEFLAQVRDHLWGLIAHQWKSGEWISLAALPADGKGAEMGFPVPSRGPLGAASVELKEASESASQGDEDQDEALGILDTMVEAEESMQAGMAALERITGLTLQNNQRMVQHAAKVSVLSSVAGTSPKALKTAVDAVADDLDLYARSLRAEVPAFVSAYTLRGNGRGRPGVD